MIYYLFFGPDDYFYVQGWCSVQDLCPFRTIFWDVILGWYHDNLFTFFLSAESKKERIGNCCGIFLNEITQPFQPQHKFHKKTEKNQNKFSSQNIVISSQNNVPKYRTKGHEQVSKHARDFASSKKSIPSRVLKGSKGQLISEWFFGVFKSSKKWTFSLTHFCPSL